LLKKNIIVTKPNTLVNQVKSKDSANHMLSSMQPTFVGATSRISSILFKRKLFKRKRLVVKKHKWNDDYITYGFYHAKEEILNLYPSQHCLFCTSVFGKE